MTATYEVSVDGFVKLACDSPDEIRDFVDKLAVGGCEVCGEGLVPADLESTTISHRRMRCVPRALCVPPSDSENAGNWWWFAHGYGQPFDGWLCGDCLEQGGYDLE